MHPNPASDVKALWVRFCIRTLKLIAAVALGSWLFCIGAKPERYVIHIRVSKSSRKVCGQPPYCLGSSPFAASLRSDSSKLVRIQLSSSVPPARSAWAAEEAVEAALDASAGVALGGGSFGSYCSPKHHIAASESFVGSGL